MSDEPPTSPNDQAIALAAQGRLAEAADTLRTALASSPNDAQLLANLGVILMRLGQLDEARGALLRATQLNPTSAFAHFNLGSALHLAGRFDDAIAAYERAIAIDPNAGGPWCNLGAALRAKGDLARSLDAYARAVELLPHSADVHVNLGVALDAASRTADAIAAYRHAIALDPAAVKAHYNLGNALSAAGDLTGAAESYARAIHLRPDLVPAHTNLGNALMRLGRRDEGVAAYERAMAIDPDAPDPRWNRALALLQRGDYARGWPEHEWRNRLDPPSSYDFPKPRWQGEPLDGRTILLHAEHGLGDTVQFARYAPLVAARGGRVVLRCQRELRHLLTTLPGVDHLIVEGDPLPPFDVHCPLMSLPLLFNTTIDTVPANVPYLHPDPARAAKWRDRLAAYPNVRRIGLRWAGRPLHQYDRERSCSLATLAPLARVPNVRFFSLQMGAGSEEAAHPPPGLHLTDWSADFTDYADTAALIAQLDLVLSVDTSVAHVAAALAKPTWLLLAFAPDWRWMLDRPDTPWYPTMRLFRQPRRGDWPTVVGEVAAALAHDRVTR